jgi:pyruvate/2-oxoglutarate dehydrogenase complex dihydrolipoamide dehydrogenase (E3) component
MAEHGWTTALIERRFAGGICTNDGRTPTKTMIASARVAELTRRGSEYGVLCDGFTIDFTQLRKRQRDLARAGRQQIKEKLARRSGLEVIYGEARFAEMKPSGTSRGLDVQLQDGATRELLADRVFLDVGQRPETPEIQSLESTPFLDSTTILQLTSVPEHLVVLDGGNIAVEFAQMFRRFGSVVTIVQAGPQLLDHEDSDIAACLLQIFSEDGIRVLVESKATAVSGDARAIAVQYEKNGVFESVHGSHLLVAVGRVPCVEALHLERVGVELTEKRYIKSECTP